MSLRRSAYARTASCGHQMMSESVTARLLRRADRLGSRNCPGPWASRAFEAAALNYSTVPAAAVLPPVTSAVRSAVFLLACVWRRLPPLGFWSGDMREALSCLCALRRLLNARCPSPTLELLVRADLGQLLLGESLNGLLPDLRSATSSRVLRRLQASTSDGLLESPDRPLLVICRV